MGPPLCPPLFRSSLRPPDAFTKTDGDNLLQNLCSEACQSTRDSDDRLPYLSLRCADLPAAHSLRYSGHGLAPDRVHRSWSTCQRRLHFQKFNVGKWAQPLGDFNFHKTCFNFQNLPLGWLLACRVLLRLCASQFFGRGDDTVWKPSSSSNLSMRAFRAYPLIEIRHSSLSSNSRQQYLSQQCPPPPPSSFVLRLLLLIIMIMLIIVIMIITIVLLILLILVIIIPLSQLSSAARTR